jgi:hypothetical protein
MRIKTREVRGRRFSGAPVRPYVRIPLVRTTAAAILSRVNEPADNDSLDRLMQLRRELLEQIVKANELGKNFPDLQKKLLETDLLIFQVQTRKRTEG